jgi:ribosomal protein S18 acetylase RimI-like enzyme
MPGYWLTFKQRGPSAPKGWPIENLRDLVRRFEVNPPSASEWWRIASSKAAQVGDRVYLFKQGGDPRGVFGVGRIIEGPEVRDSPNDLEGAQPRALVAFDALVDPTKDFLLALEELEDVVPRTTINAQASGTGLTDKVADELDRRLAHRLNVRPAVDPMSADDGSFDPDSVTDERKRMNRAIRIRRGQPAFRNELLAAYGGRCAVTGCGVIDVLEAAHITPHLGKLTNHVSNGLLLRADIHTLLDCSMLAIHPETRRIVIGRELMESSYAKLADKRLRPTVAENQGPSRKCLEGRFTEFLTQRKARLTPGPTQPEREEATA